jgi:amino-acid N-acetyltransferase
MQAEESKESGEARREGGLIMSASARQALLISARPMLQTAVAILEVAGLPALDLTVSHLQHFFYTGTNDAPTGIIGLELFGSDALLRSLAVEPAARDSGLGSALVAHAEGYARSQGVKTMYLLTTTAEEFFALRGYRRIARSVVSTTIQGTREFTQLCPDSSSLMTKAL